MSSTAGPGERNLRILLSTLTATLHEETYVFVTIPASRYSKPSTMPQDVLPNAQMIFNEAEGVTLILPITVARAHEWDYAFPCRKISLNVQSSLSAVGFLAAITEKLKAVDMPVNAVSAFYHDHLFVPEGREREAIEVLEALAREAKEQQ